MLLLSLRRIRLTAITIVLLFSSRKKKRPTVRTSRLWPLVLPVSLLLLSLRKIRTTASTTDSESSALRS